MKPRCHFVQVTWRLLVFLKGLFLHVMKMHELLSATKETITYDEGYMNMKNKLIIQNKLHTYNVMQ